MSGPKPSHEPGPELDAMLAEKMGWTRVTLYERELVPEFFTGDAPHMYGDGVPAVWLVPSGTDVSHGVGVRLQVGELRLGHPLPPYSTDPAAAIRAAEEMREKGRIGSWSVAVSRDGHVGGFVVGDHKSKDVAERGISPAHALTLALLEALRG